MIENTTRSELEQPDNQSFYIEDLGRKALEDRLKEVLGEDRQAILKITCQYLNKASNLPLVTSKALKSLHMPFKAL